MCKELSIAPETSIPNKNGAVRAFSLAKAYAKQKGFVYLGGAPGEQSFSKLGKLNRMGTYVRLDLLAFWSIATNARKSMIVPVQVF